jgi:phage-related protein
MNNTIKWDGVFTIDHEPIVKTALLSYITDEEKQTAMTSSYGDLGKALRKKYYNGTSITIPVNGVSYEMTWNKVAKAIHRWIKEER